MIAKLERLTELSGPDRTALENLSGSTQSFAANVDLIRQGTRHETALLIVEGWACRYKLLPDGSRQIVGFAIPGDLCEAQIFTGWRTDHAVATLGAATVSMIPINQILAAMDQRPRLARAFWLAALVDASVLREWLVNAGRRAPYDQVAHLLCEMWLRMKSVGLVSASSRFSLPLTQSDLADAMGLTPVTVNRVLQKLRQEALITLAGGKLTVLDIDRLMTLSGFDPSYLHLLQRQPAGVRPAGVSSRNAEKPS